MALARVVEEAVERRRSAASSLPAPFHEPPEWMEANTPSRAERDAGRSGESAMARSKQARLDPVAALDLAVFRIRGEMRHRRSEFRLALAIHQAREALDLLDGGKRPAPPKA